MGGARIGRVAVALVVAVAVAVAPVPASAAAPKPVYSGAQVADPGVVKTGGRFYAFATGTRAPLFRGDNAGGPWKELHPALASVPAWAVNGGAWAPDAVHTSAGWVLYFALAAKGLNGQRCIGVATAPKIEDKFTPAAKPLVCPGGRDGAHDTVPGRPLAGAGVIDPAAFQHSDGRRFLVYKTQQTPSSIRLLRLDAAGTDWTGTASTELIRNSGIIENPQIVQRGSTFVLFASRYGYNSCGYDTAYYTSTDLRDFHHSAQHDLTTRASTGGLCGPGGASVTTSLDGGWRIFLAAWTCGKNPCTTTKTVPKSARRALYAAVLTWSGATPSRGEFL